MPLPAAGGKQFTTYNKKCDDYSNESAILLVGIGTWVYEKTYKEFSFSIFYVREKLETA